MRTASVLTLVVVCFGIGLLFGQERSVQDKEQQLVQVKDKEKEKDKQPAWAGPKWEYKQMEKGLGGLKARDLEAELNALGAEGWELVTPYHNTPNEGSIRFVFKRLKR